MAYKLLSLFDGSGGFPLAGSLCGIVPVAASEVEPYPIAVTRSRFPGMKHLGDISKINGAEIEPVNVITFGSPCQDLSVAGKRAGIKHEASGDEETTRSGLFMEAVRIIKEMRRATNGLYPNVVLWENVPGAFSSNRGEDFRTVLDELIKIVEPCAVMPPVPKSGWAYADSYCGDGWSLAYRVFDAQYWGVPQRRRRIHLVLHLTGRSARKILFEREGLRGYFEAGSNSRKRAETDLENGIGADNRNGENGCVAFHLLQDPIQSDRVFPCLCQGNSDRGQASLGVAYGLDGYNSTLTGDISATLGVNCGISTGRNGVVVESVDVLPFDTTQVTSPANYSNPKWGDPCHPLAAGAHPPTVICCIDGDKIGKAERSGGSGLGIRPGDKMYTLTAKDAGTHSVCIPIHDKATRYKGGGSDRKNDGSGNGLGVGKDGAPAPTLTAGDRHSVCYAVTYQNCTGPLMVNSECAGIDCRNLNEYPELYPTLQAKPNGGQSLNFSGAVRVRYIVRRLTPTECQRLQGFADAWGVPDQKDDFTDEEYRFWLKVRKTHATIFGKIFKKYTKAQMLTWYNKLHTDSAEYKMWGNGIALPPALYCMQGIVDALEEGSK